MEPCTIPNTTLKVSPLCLGAMTFGTPVAEADTVQIPHWALTDTMFDLLSQAEADAKSRNRTLLQHAQLSLLENPAVVSLIIGVKRIQQLEAAVKALE